MESIFFILIGITLIAICLVINKEMKKTSELHDRQTKLDIYIQDLEAEQSGLIETVMKNEIQIDVLTRDAEELKAEFSDLAPKELQKWINYLKKEIKARNKTIKPKYKTGLVNPINDSKEISITEIIPIFDDYGLIIDFRYQFTYVKSGVSSDASENWLISRYNTNI